MMAVNERKSLTIINLLKNETPIKINFNGNYGKIAEFDYLNDGRVVVAFNKGNILLINIYSE